MQRRVGEQQAELGQSWRHAGSQGGVRPPLGEHDRPAGRHQLLFGRQGDLAQLAGLGEVGHEHREGLVVALLATPQLGHGGFVGGVHRQVVATEAFDGQDPPGAQRGHGGLQGGLTVPVLQAVVEAVVEGEQPQLGAAVTAGVGLGVEAAVAGVVVLLLAPIAHHEAGHGGGGPVVGDGGDDGVPGTAVGAVGERVAEAAVRRVVDLCQARRAGGRVDAHRHGGGAGVVGGHDAKALPRRRGDRRGDHRRHPGEWRRIGAQRLVERGHGLGRALDLDQHTGGVVAHEAVESQCHRPPVHERPETHPLHRPGHPDPGSHDARRRRSHPPVGRGAISRFVAAGRRRACRRCGCRRRWCAARRCPPARP
ncbi:hypothetical protein BH20ACT2_BH20ACT2_15910 [soil metagenome]